MSLVDSESGSCFVTERSTTNYQPLTFIRLFNNSQKVWNFVDDAAHRGRIRATDRLVELRYAEAFDDVLLLLRIADRTAVILYLDRSAGRIFVLICHDLFLISDLSSQISNGGGFSPGQLKSRNQDLELNEFLHLLAAEPCDLGRIFHAKQAVEGSADNVMGVVRAKDLGTHIVHAERLEDCTNGSARDNACTLGGRFE